MRILSMKRARCAIPSSKTFGLRGYCCIVVTLLSCFSGGWRRAGPWRSGMACSRVCGAATAKGHEHVRVTRRQDPGERASLSFDAQHLLEFRDNLDEIGLLVHHGMDVFIGLRNLIHDAVIFAAFDAGGLLAQVFRGESPFGFSA